jgi:multimeric flavodoxin WrbA
MKIVVLGGSPKGNKSVTMQYVKYIQRILPDHEFNLLTISSRIKTLEKDEKAFFGVMDEIRSSDGVIWAFPLYVFLVPSQYKRFIELIWERNAQDVFKEKYAAVLTTSINFFDHIAHNYMQSVCDDLEMRFAGAFSAEMHDLRNPAGQKKTRLFGESFVETIVKGYPTTRRFPPILSSDTKYIPGIPSIKVDAPGKEVTIVHDAKEDQVNLLNMIQRMRLCFAQEVAVYNLHDVKIKAGCLGCLKCGQNYRCAYTGKDDFIDFYNEKVKSANILIFAGTLTDRFLSSRWKMFFDRGFFNCHTPSLVGKQFAFLLSGPLRQNWNLREMLEGYVQWQGSNVVDFVSDEVADSKELDEQLSGLAARLAWNSRLGYIKPKTFLGVGGHKIFRDDIFSSLRFVFQADHRYYKKNGLYDFPQKRVGLRITNVVLGMLFRTPRIRREFDRVVTQKMIEPHQKVVDSVSKKDA